LEFFHCLNLVRRSNSLVSTQPLRDMRKPSMSPRSTGGRCLRLAKLPISFANFLEILGGPNSWIPKDLFSSEQG